MQSSAFTVTIKHSGISWNPEGVTHDLTAGDLVELCRKCQDFYDLIAGSPVEEVLNNYLKTTNPAEHYAEDLELYCEVSSSWL